MLLSEAIEAVGKMLKGYAYATKTDSGYIGAIASMLCTYPRQVVLKCTDPIKGLARTCKFLPTPADVVAWCENETAPLYDTAERDRRAAEQIAEREPPQFDPVERERVKAGFKDLTQALNAPKQAGAPPKDTKTAEYEARQKREHERRISGVVDDWKARGEEAPTIGGIPVSRELVSTMRAAHQDAAE